MSRRGPGNPLTAREERFVEEYLKDLNASQALIRAGGGGKNPDVNSHAMLHRPVVAAAIAAARKKLSEKHEITVDRIIQEYARIAFCDIRKFYDKKGRLKAVVELDDDESAALASLDHEERMYADESDRIIKEVTRKIRLWDKTKGLDQLGKHLGLFKDKVEVSLTQDDAWREMMLYAKELKQRRLGAGTSHNGKPMAVLEGVIEIPIQDSQEERSGS